ncbi:MAG TPA: gluconokinase, GntK/IdnK-type [Stellaceae bacterium]|jgi:carbohydrate kinase (thermoresistant glucokinase family)|nr:gluconokinase, GntK/IdnK-type [Stellaceae bacterium]
MSTTAQPRSNPDVAAREAAAAKQVTPVVLVLMGVSGSGKSTVAQELQRVLGWPFQEGDDLHPPANVEKMRAGQPLNDADRLPWLRAIAAWIDGQLAASQPGIVTCSNLKRAYRDITVGERRGVTLVYLKGAEPVIRERIEARTHRYMPATLLGSQFETLEEPGLDEHPVTVAVHGSIAETVTEILQQLAARSRAASG